MFRQPQPDKDGLKKRWGLDSDAIDEKLSKKQFSFAHFDLESLSLSYYNPVELPPSNAKPVDGTEKKKKTKVPKGPDLYRLIGKMS